MGWITKKSNVTNHGFAHNIYFLDASIRHRKDIDYMSSSAAYSAVSM